MYCSNRSLSGSSVVAMNLLAFPVTKITYLGGQGQGQCAGDHFKRE